MSYLTDAADRLDGEREYPTPGALAVDLDPRTRQSKVLELLDRALVETVEGKQRRLLFTMPPQEGKSQRVSRRFPLWLLKRNPDARIAVVSYAQNLAERWGRVVRNDIIANPQLGLRIGRGSAAVGEWQLEGHDGGMVCVGIGAGLTGRPIDGALIIDDPFKDRAEADSETFRERAESWWREVGSTRLAPGTPVICVMTCWHEADLSGLFRADPSFRCINVPAVADHRPELGEVDVIGRQPGEIMPSVRDRTLEEWQQKRKDAGSRGWAAIYQGRPAPQEGNIFRRGWWRYHHLMPRTRPDGTMFAPGIEEYLISVDCSFKDTSKSDYVAIHVWGRAGSRARLLARIKDRMDFPATQAALIQVCAQWPEARLRLIEDTANGPAVIASLRGVIGGLIPVKPEGSKEARAHAVSPWIEAGDVELPHPSLAPWVGEVIDECAAFPNGTHDDDVDALTQALDRLLGQGTGLAGFMQRLADQRRAA